MGPATPRINILGPLECRVGGERLRLLPAGRSEDAARQLFVRIDLDDLSVVDFTSGPGEFELSRSELATSREDCLVITATRTGSARLHLRDGVIDLAPASFVAWHAREARHLRVARRLVNRNLLVPRSALAELGARGRGLRTGPVPPEGLAVARLLFRHLDTAMDVAPGVAGRELVSLRNATLELAVAALGGRPAPAGPEDHWPVRATIDRYIDHHLDDRALTPASIAAAANISIRTLYRRFKPTGESVGEYIRRRRLARARQDLVAGGGAATVSAIAYRWCFADPSHFTREFRRQYGYPPRDCLRS